MIEGETAPIVNDLKLSQADAVRTSLRALLKEFLDEQCTMLALDSYTTNFKAHKFFYGQGFAPRGFHFINILDKTKVR